MELKDISGIGDGVGPFSSQLVEFFSPPSNPPEMTPQSG
jgi:hypothetical protein